MNLDNKNLLSFKKWFLAGIFFRVIAVYLSLKYSRFIWADTGGLLLEAQTICGFGQWGGSSYKPPMYGWILCALSNGSAAPGVYTAATAVVVLQTLLCLLMGLWIYKKFTESKAYILWLFDPGLLLYSVMIMTDSLYSVWLMGACLMAIEFLLPQNKRLSYFHSIGLAFFLACTILQRSNGFLAGLLLLMPIILFLFKNKKLNKQILATIILLFVFLSPRSIYSLINYNSLGFAGQGAGWLTTVAAVSEFAPQGYDFFTSEKMWVEKYPNPARNFALLKIKENFGSFLKYSLMGTARTLLGHLNVEFGYLITGKSVIGPALTRPPEPRDGPTVHGSMYLVWIVGILFTLIFTGFTYAYIVCTIFKSRSYISYSSYFFVAGTVMAAIPLVFGDGRFRLGIWPFFITALLLLERNGKRPNQAR